MKRIKQLSSLLIILIFLPFVLYSNNHFSGDENLTVGNKEIKFSFDTSSGSLLSFSDLIHSTPILKSHQNSDYNSIWNIFLVNQSGLTELNIHNAHIFHSIKLGNREVQLEWSGFSIASNPSLKVTVKVTVDSVKPISRWHISVTGIHGEKIEKVTFPHIEGIANRQGIELAVPAWMGELIKIPGKYEHGQTGLSKTYSWNYPGLLSMQFMALYDKENKGIYFATNDTLNYFKQFSLLVDSTSGLSYNVNNYPPFDSTLMTYIPPYDAIIGLFNGDWLSAATIYRNWATNQRWCRESQFKKDSANLWINKTALWVWNRGKSDNVLVPAEFLKKKLNLPVNVLWHWWHGCAYDDGFPDYFPPREGPASFNQAISKANSEGVKAILYMNSFEWGTSTKSFKNENASKWAVRDINGNMEPHVFNIFTKHSLTPMCMATNFWRNKYSSLADKAINEYNIGGIYMDQACDSYLCYDKDHGHSIGGGNYWVNGFRLLTNKIREDNKSGHKIALGGEGCSENWLPFLNAFLTLQVSNERYSGVNGPQTIPLFQAVYHQYGITFGNYSSLVTPPYDDLWPKQYAPKNPEQLLAPKFNEQFLMEQARSFVWGMQPTIANYHDFLSKDRSEEMDYVINLSKLRYKVLKYLLYGEFVRSPEIKSIEKIIPISRLSIYAGQEDRVKSFQEKVPLLYTSAWKAYDGSLGLAFASISTASTPINLIFNSNSYGLGRSGKIYLITVGKKELLGSYHGGKIKVNFNLPSRGLYFLEVNPNS